MEKTSKRGKFEEEDLFDKIDDNILQIIWTLISFKETGRNCVLSKRFQHMLLRSKNIEFNEEFFVKDNGFPPHKAREEFEQFVQNYIQNYQGGNQIEKLSLKYSRPPAFDSVHTNCINFALTHNVKSLGIDFSDPSWEINQVDFDDQESFDLPELKDIFCHKTLETLKLISCSGNMKGISLLKFLKKLTLGRVELNELGLFATCELESVKLLKCKMEYFKINGKRLKRLMIHECEIKSSYIHIEAPELCFFRYIGNMVTFRVGEQACHEVYLQYQPFEHGFRGLGNRLKDLLRKLLKVEVLTICSNLLQVIPSGSTHLCLQRKLGVKHLTIKSKLHQNDIFGLQFILRSCPALKHLTIELENEFICYHNYIAPVLFQKESFSCKCIEHTLEYVQMDGFTGAANEVLLLTWILQGTALKRVKLLLARHVDVEYIQKKLKNKSNKVFISVRE